jgi:prolyl oligopeptidase
VVIEEIHGQRLADPYRVLEDSEDPGTTAWNARQDELFATARRGWPDRDALRSCLAELSGIGWVGAPYWRGDRSFSMCREPGQDHAVVVVTEPSGERRVLIDPGALDPTGATTLDVWQPSQEGDLLAYGLSTGGTEWAAIGVLDVATGEVVDGPVDRTRHPTIAWLPGGAAYYYVRFLTMDDQHPDRLRQRVYLHRTGTDPAGDVEVFGAGLPRATYLEVDISVDGRWLAVTAARGTDARNDVWLADLATGTPAFTPVLVGADARSQPSFDGRGNLWLLTNHEAPRGRICRVAGDWTEVIAEDPEAVIADFAVLADAGLLVLLRTRYAVSELTVHDLATGARLRELVLPGLGSVTELSYRRTGSFVWLSYTDHSTPGYVVRADAATGELTTFARPPGPPAPDVEITTRQITYRSYDGTPVRMFLIEPAGPARPRPTILYGYGGFNISMIPAYSPRIMAWVTSGGVYAAASLRGGGEEGEAWHSAGMRQHKTNGFDDFAAASDWLVDQGVTTRDRLAIYGRSNGGLLVGAALTRHPDKYAAAVCAAPLLDMLRYERFGLGELWNGEYGRVADPEEFGWLWSYSPYHRVVDGVDYPAVLFVVFEGDTRVDPLHGRKMCARLQAATGGTRPILIRRETGVGHASRAVSRDVELAADELAFLTAQLGGG